MAKSKISVSAFVLPTVLAIALVAGVYAVNKPKAIQKSEAATIRGSVEDPNNPGIGLIEYQGNPSGYHFWFTPTENVNVYVAGHDYHNIYKFELDDSSDWCPRQALVPDRVPYNIVAEPGISVWYKIYDVTTGTYHCIE